MITLELFKTELERLVAHCRQQAKEGQELLDSLESNDDDLPSDWDFDQSGDRINDTHNG